MLGHLVTNHHHDIAPRTQRHWLRWFMALFSRR